MLKNPKQERFCVEFLKIGNAKSAYMTAYGTTNEQGAAVSAHKLLRREEIKIRIKELEEKIMTEKICDVQEIQERLSQIARREIRDTIVLPNGELTTKPVSIRDCLKAIEILCKVKGMYLTKQEVDMKGLVPVVIHDDI